MHHYNWLVDRLFTTGDRNSSSTSALRPPQSTTNLFYQRQIGLDWIRLVSIVLQRNEKCHPCCEHILVCGDFHTCQQDQLTALQSNHGSVLGEVHSMVKSKFNLRVTRFILLHQKFLQCDWLRAVVFQRNLKYLDVKITNLLWVVV